MGTLALVPTCRPLLPSTVDSGANEQMEPHTEEIEEFMRVEVASWGMDEYMKAFDHKEMRQDVVRNLVTEEEADSDLSNASVTIRVVSAKFRNKKGVCKTKCLVTVGSHVVLDTETVKNTGSPEWTAVQSLNRIDICESDELLIHVIGENGAASNVVGTGIDRVKDLRGVTRQRTVCLALQGGKSGYVLLSLAYSDSKERESRLLERKYSVAGGNVHLMFNATIDTAITQVKRLVHNTRNVIPHLVYGSDALPTSTDQLLARYLIPHAKPDQVVLLEQVFTKDKSTDYCIYPAWMISSLQHTSVEIADSKTVLPVGKVAFFDPRAPVIDDLPLWTWWVPILWFPGCVDVLSVVPEDNRVSVLRLVDSSVPRFDCFAFYQLLMALKMDVRHVWLFFLVPSKLLSSFVVPVDKASVSNALPIPGIDVSVIIRSVDFNY